MLPRNHGKSQHYAILMANLKAYEMALDEVLKAYPEDIFPSTTQAERDPIIQKYPGFIDRTSAMMGRHIAKVIRERAARFAREILEEQSGGLTPLTMDVCPLCRGKGAHQVGVYVDPDCNGTGKRH